MKTYTADEIREIALENGDEEIIARFNQYIADGLVNKSVPKPTGKFKPMAALTGSLDKIKVFPIFAGPKYDGVRGILHNEYGLISRASKRIPNLHIRSILEESNIHFVDGEILTYTNGKLDDFNTTQSKVMTGEGYPDFKIIIFDDFEFPQLGYKDRLDNAAKKISGKPYFELAAHKLIHNMAELIAYENYCASMSEGMVVRKIEAAYKFGKSTLKELALVKIKRFSDDEGVIHAIAQITNGLPMVGAFTVIWKKKVFQIGNGWNDKLATEMWRDRHNLIGKTVTFKYQGVGTNGLPRFSSFLGIRRDL